MRRCPQCGYRELPGKPKVTTRLRGRNLRPVDRDEAAKLVRGYTNDRSYVRRDGSERLHGEDWDNRKTEVWRRSDGACEMISVMKREHDEHCSGDMHHPHHIIQRSVRRDDSLSNLAGLSIACHRAVDQRKVGGRSRCDERPIQGSNEARRGNKS